MSNWKSRLSNANFFRLFCLGLSICNLHLGNSIWHYVIALVHPQLISLLLEQVSNSPLQMHNLLPHTPILVSATWCVFTYVQYIFGVQISLLQILKLYYQIQISNSFWFFVNTSKCQYLHYQMWIWNCKHQTTKSDICARMSITLCKNYLQFCIIKYKFYTIKIQIAFERKINIYSGKITICRCKFCFWECK